MISRCFVAGLVVVFCALQVKAQSPPHRIRLAPRVESDALDEQRWYPKPVTTRLGEVVAFDQRQLAIILVGEVEPTRFPADRVLSIEWSETPQEQTDALKLFDDGEYAEALKGLVGAISKKDSAQRPPVWRQQRLSMLAAQAAWRSGRGDIALELVEQLDRRPLPTLVLGLLPINWIGSVSSQSIENAAAERAKSDSLAVKLVAASWLIRSPKYGEAAESAINRLANLNAPIISQLAQQLYWRTKTPVELRSEWQRWETEIDALPMPIQSGPRLALESALRSAGIQDAARGQRLILETAAPVWHPDLPSKSPTEPFMSR